MKKPLFGLVGAIAISAAIMLSAAGGGEDGVAHAQSRGEARRSPVSPDAERIRREIQNDPVAPTIAPVGHDVTIVFFSDYQCVYCRKVHPVLTALLDEDRKVKLVHRDWPIFGAASTETARLAIASRHQGKHAAFNDALMRSQGKLSPEAIRAAAQRAGVDWTRLQADLVRHRAEIDQALGRTGRYAAMLGLTGTPAMLVGNYLIPGAVDLPVMRRAVAMARAQARAAQGATPAR